MSNIPTELKYAATHEWLRHEGDGVYTMGISDHAQELLGELVYVELPDEGDEFAAGDDCCVAESVKAASDVYAPVNGTIVANNPALEDAPELVNSDPYGEGWFIKIKITDEADLSELLDAEAYKNSIDED